MSGLPKALARDRPWDGGLETRKEICEYCKCREFRVDREALHKVCMRYAIAILAMSGCASPPPSPPHPTPPASAIHSWPPSEARDIEAGKLWKGMSIEQFECAASFGREFYMFPPSGPHIHRRANLQQQTSDYLVIRFEQAFMWIEGWFVDGKMINYLVTVF